MQFCLKGFQRVCIALFGQAASTEARRKANDSQFDAAPEVVREQHESHATQIEPEESSPIATTNRDLESPVIRTDTAATLDVQQISHPSVLFRISRSFRDGMSAEELYEATRGVWRVSANRARAQYAMPVVRNRIIEVYEIQRWDPAGATPYRSRQLSANDMAGRWEFVGRLASDDIRKRYIDRSVDEYYPPGSMNPVAYALRGI